MADIDGNGCLDFDEFKLLFATECEKDAEISKARYKKLGSIEDPEAYALSLSLLMQGKQNELIKQDPDTLKVSEIKEIVHPTPLNEIEQMNCYELSKLYEKNTRLNESRVKNVDVNNPQSEVKDMVLSVSREARMSIKGKKHIEQSGVQLFNRPQSDKLTFQLS